MKKKLFVFIYIFVVTINVFSQSSYRFQGKVIRLNVDSSMYFIQTENEQLFTARNITLKQRNQKGQINSFHKISNPLSSRIYNH